MNTIFHLINFYFNCKCIVNRLKITVITDVTIIVITSNFLYKVSIITCYIYINQCHIFHIFLTEEDSWKNFPLQCVTEKEKLRKKNRLLYKVGRKGLNPFKPGRRKPGTFRTLNSQTVEACSAQFHMQIDGLIFNMVCCETKNGGL